MRVINLATAMVTLALASLAGVIGCGYLPSEMVGSMGNNNPKVTPLRISPKIYSAHCGTAARDFRKLTFNDIYTPFDDPSSPFHKTGKLPVQYDVVAYVWGRNNCPSSECRGDDNLWLVERGPGQSLWTWLVKPQPLRIGLQPSCKNQLKVGERYRFSFGRGEMLGFSRY